MQSKQNELTFAGSVFQFSSMNAFKKKGFLEFIELMMAVLNTMVYCASFLPSQRFRNNMTQAGFTISGTAHPICPVMLGDARLASLMADDMLKLGENSGVYVMSN